MTRFARARGSKSSNERLPEEATSWQVMRKQLERAQEQQEFLRQRKERRATVLKHDSVEPESREWAEFETKPTKKKEKTKKNASAISGFEVGEKNLLKKKVNEGENHIIDDAGRVTEEKGKKRKASSWEVSPAQDKKSKKLKRKKLKQSHGMNDESEKLGENSELDNKTDSLGEMKLFKEVIEGENNLIDETQQKKNKKRKASCMEASPGQVIKQKKFKNKTVKQSHGTDEANESERAREAAQDDGTGDGGQAISKVDRKMERIKKNKSKQRSNISEAGNISRRNEACEQAEAVHKNWNNKKGHRGETNNRVQASFHKKEGKIYKRRKPDEGTQMFYINGQAIEIVKFDGFPVKKKDAERLKELKQKMIAKGIPLDEVKQAMKLERRKAEKALAREKKKVCFHCRKPGHNLSECPELDDGKSNDVQGTGICFKCGSTEHTYYECRVNRSEGFQFAKCFICNEQGHIARQCPDNPRGLYPKGGACRVCGDVTHLKKDCPDLVQEKNEQTMTLETLKSGALEALDEDLKHQPQQKIIKKQKHIKF